MPPDDPLLKVDRLTVIFHGRERQTIRAVDGVSFHIDRGESLGLVGESGSGKTTAGRVIVGLTTPDEGIIQFCGRKLGHGIGHSSRQGMQIVLQDAAGSLNPRLRIGISVAEPMVLQRVGSRRDRLRQVDELLDKVGLPPSSAARFPRELSGGQRQRVAIARALAARPNFIVFDEPVSALDVSVQAQILNLLNDLRRELSLTYLLISHNLAVVAGFCERVAVMQRGRIVETGGSRAVFRSPQDAYTKALVAAVPRLGPKVVPLAASQ